MKIVINTCFGGFSLSHAAIMRYAKLKGMDLFIREGEFNMTFYYTKPPTYDYFYSSPIFDEESWFYDRDIKRDDPALVQVVEELGAKANGDYAELAIVEVPDGVDWYVSEYDGREHVAENHRTWY